MAATKSIPNPVYTRILATLETDGPGTEAEIHGSMRHWRLTPTLDDIKVTLANLATSKHVRCEMQGGRRIWHIVKARDPAHHALLRMAG